MNREELKEYICPFDVFIDCVTGESGTSCDKCNELLNKWLDQYEAEIRAEVIDGCIKMVTDEHLCLVLEQMKEQKNEWRKL